MKQHTNYSKAEIEAGRTMRVLLLIAGALITIVTVLNACSII